MKHRHGRLEEEDSLKNLKQSLATVDSPPHRKRHRPWSTNASSSSRFTVVVVAVLLLVTSVLGWMGWIGFHNDTPFFSSFIFSSSRTDLVQHNVPPSSHGLADNTNADDIGNGNDDTFRILYVVTSSGKTYVQAKSRTTLDRWKDLILPTLQHNVESFLGLHDRHRRDDDDDRKQHHHPHTNSQLLLPTNVVVHVDLYLILSYTLNISEQTQLRQRLPPSVGIQFWQNAAPFAYNCQFWNDDDGDNDLAMTTTVGRPKQHHHRGTQCQDWHRQLHGERYKGPLQFDMNQTRLLVAGAQLARQHRYVIKDKFPYYDFFVVAEDDMILNRHHLEQHRQMMTRIRQLQEQTSSKKHKQRQRQAEEKDEQPVGVVREDTGTSNTTTTSKMKGRDKKANHPWNIDLDQKYLARIRPGFIRVEVLDSGAQQRNTRDELPPDQLPYDIQTILEQRRQEPRKSGHDNNAINRNMIDPTICCTIPKHIDIPAISNRHPTPKDLMIWETNVLGFNVRPWARIDANHDNTTMTKRSSNDWIAATLAGTPGFPSSWSGRYLRSSRSSSNNNNKHHPHHHHHGLLQPPDRLHAEYMAQSAGWFGSPREVMEYHTQFCKGSFLPPYDAPVHIRDGLWRHNVEFWSGGIQLWGGMCEIQRVLSLGNATDFSRHLIYHASNNKQHMMPPERMVRANTLWEELEYVQSEMMADLRME